MSRISLYSSQCKRTCSSFSTSPQTHRRISGGTRAHLPVSMRSLCELVRILVTAIRVCSGTWSVYIWCVVRSGFMCTYVFRFVVSDLLIRCLILSLDIFTGSSASCSIYAKYLPHGDPESRIKPKNLTKCDPWKSVRVISLRKKLCCLF